MAPWLVVALPIAQRRVYGESRLSSLKGGGLTVLYLFGFLFFGFGVATFLAVATF